MANRNLVPSDFRALPYSPQTSGGISVGGVETEHPVLRAVKVYTGPKRGGAALRPLPGTSGVPDR
jgi:hypothetical protein